MQLTIDFFHELDSRWPGGGDRLQLAVIGCSALLLQTTYARATRDSDVFETMQLTPAIQERLLEIAGRDTEMHKRHRLYLDIVRNGIPFLPHAPVWHRVAALAQLANLEVVVLDVVDVCVSKLKRFHMNDRDDIDAMARLGLVSHARLVERFRSAVDDFSGDARAHQLPEIIDNFHQVETDMLGVEPTEIELPSWV